MQRQQLREAADRQAAKRSAGPQARAPAGAARAARAKRAAPGEAGGAALNEIEEWSIAMWIARLVWPANRNVSADWPRLAEAGGRPELDLALAGRIKAGG
tara:strand:- start:121 stop:420 length:300 start_codon:yes stop_codon:yes gene_type:complete